MNPLLPREAEVIGRDQESPTIFSLHLRFTDARVAAGWHFEPGQFNMLYMAGIGEVPISISSDPDDEERFSHTIRVVGRETRALARLQPGDRIGVRGPFGRGWPLERLEGRDVAVVTGGLGCAPTVALIDYLMHRRRRFGRVAIVQGVKHSEDLLWRERYDEWGRRPETRVLLAADVVRGKWPGIQGPVTALFDRLELDFGNTASVMCGPQPMMVAAAHGLMERGVVARRIWLSMERNMQCAVGLCGHCQFGSAFVCRDGPVFSWPELEPLIHQKGF